YREAQERFLDELLFPPPETDPGLRASFLVEAHRRILVPLSAFTFSLIPLVCPLPGEFNRRGQATRALVAIAIAFIFEVLDIGVNDLAVRSAAAIPLMYATDLLPFVLGFAILLRGNNRLSFRRSGLAAVPAS
ncbi:MAG: LptF/LptG family permease, partial [Alphaproteobacteria bacterium]